MQKLPRVCGDKHVAAFKKAGWKLNHIEGSHYVLIKGGSDVHTRFSRSEHGNTARRLQKMTILLLFEYLHEHRMSPSEHPPCTYLLRSEIAPTKNHYLLIGYVSLRISL